MVLDVPFYFWYSVPLLASLTFGAGVGLGFMVQPEQMRSKTTFTKLSRAMLLIEAVVMAAITLGVGLRNVQHSTSKLSKIPAKTEAYIATGRWLAENTPGDSTVGFIEVGLVGYFSNRQIVDLLGLTTPGTESYLMRRDHAGLVEAYHPDYHIRNTNFDGWGMNKTVHESIYFKTHYKPVAEIPHRGAEPIVIYRWTGE